MYRETERPAAAAADSRPLLRRSPPRKPARFVLNLAATHGRHLAARLERPPRSGDTLLRRGRGRRRRTAAQRAVSLRSRQRRRCPITRSRCRLPLGYTPNDASVGDLDGDGQYEIVLHQTGVRKDNSQPGVTDAPIFQAYKLDGTLLWTINLGHNVREGAHYTQFLVYDFDGDGRAEFVCKDRRRHHRWHRRGAGRCQARTGSRPNPPARMPGAVTAPRREGTSRAGFIVSGPEYLTVFDGLTGKALASETYLPRRHPDTDSPTPEADEGDLGRRPRQSHRPVPRRRLPISTASIRAS